MTGRTVLVVCAVALAGCAVRPPPVNVVTIPESYSAPFDAVHGDRLDLVMDPTGNMAGRCTAAGGELVRRTSGVYVCEGVDF